MSRPIILFDIEYTAWEGSKARKWSGPGEQREIIQIAAIQIETNREVLETGCFDRLVKPKRNPILSAYIRELTGITQPALDTQGVSFLEAFAGFYAFCGRGQIPLFCYGDDDPNVFLENYRLNSMEPPAFPAGMHDIRAVFEGAGIDTQAYTSGTVHRAVGAEFNLLAHNALNDVRSLVVTIRQLISTGRIGRDWVEGSPFQGK